MAVAYTASTQSVTQQIIFFLKMTKDLPWDELGRSFHQLGTVKVKVSESDFVPRLALQRKLLWGT